MILRHFLPACALGLSSLCFADDSDWRYGLPDTGLTPSFFEYEALTSADERNGGSSYGMQKLGMSVPLSDPRKSGYQRWLFSAELDANLSELNTGGRIELSEETMYALSVPLALVRSYTSGNRLTLAVVPSLASDMGHASGGFTIGGMAYYKVKHSDTFTYSFGAAFSQRYDRSGFVPLIGFDWKMAPDWTLSLSKLDLALEYKVNERFKVGPYMGTISDSWTIHEDKESYWLRTLALVAGVKGQYNVAAEGQAKKVIDFAVGATIFSRVKIEEHTWHQDEVLNECYDPALYVRLGFDMRF